MSFEFLHLQPADYNDASAKDNDRSCVLRIVSPYGSILLPGDIENRSESRLLQSSGTLPTDILIAPQHGCRTSSTPEFVHAVAPGLTVF
jgi:competence protein ComEC